MRTLVEVDLVQAEWVVTAFIARDSNMLGVVYSGADPHLRTGSYITGAPEDFVRYEDSLVGHLTDPLEIAKKRLELPKEWNGTPVSRFFLPRTVSGRQAGKRSNHGLNYNMRYKEFALVNEMEEREAAKIVSLYRDVAYPGVKDFHKYVEHLLRRDRRRLVNCFGQAAEFMDEWNHKLLDSAYSFFPQSTVGNVTNFGWRSLYHDSTRVMRKVEPRLQLHDSIASHHEFYSWTELAMQCIRVLDHMTTICEYHGVPFIIGRELKIGCNFGSMESVTKIPVNRSVDSLDGRLMEQLEKAWNISCAPPPERYSGGVA